MNSGFKLIDSGWDKVIGQAAASGCPKLRIVCPFIKVNTVLRLLGTKRDKSVHVITRFNLGEMCLGVNDVEALRLLLEHGAKIRGVKGLHAKLYLFGNEQAVVTSANLTEAAFLRNHEFGFAATKPEIIQSCREYFERLWSKAGNDLSPEKLEEWDSKIKKVRTAGARPSVVLGLPDEGMRVPGWEAEELVAPPTSRPITDAPQAFVKFFGVSSERERRELPIIDEVRATGCHWACTYPKGKRPRKVRDGAIMFMGSLVKDPNDILIYGRATALQHVESRDEASADEIKRRPWKESWPIYVRVHHAEFLAGTLGNAISLSALMEELGPDSFLSTQNNKRGGEGNIDPRGAYRQQPQVELTKEAFSWLNQQLQSAFSRHGKLTPAELETLDWPSVPFQGAPPPSHLPEFQKWLMRVEGKAETTGASYSSLLTRCAEKYGEVINEMTIREAADVEGLTDRIRRDLRESGGYDGRFTITNIKDGFLPAIHAYLRFVQASFPIERLRGKKRV